MKNRVTGIGGVFFKAKDPKALLEWYRRHLGLDITEYGWSFRWEDDKQSARLTQLGVFAESSDYFDPSTQNWMINFRVEDLDGLLEVLKEEGVTLVGTPETYDYGKFGWILDPEGNKIELWQPMGEL